MIIPRAWLRYYNLDYGDELQIITNGSIEIKPLNQIKIEDDIFE